jgi:hypothetical protein
MTDWNDPMDGTRSGGLDTDTLDRMLAGGIHPDDAPPGYSEVARVLLAVAEATDNAELVHETAHVALAIELVQQRSPVSASSNQRSIRRSQSTMSRKHRGKIGGLVVIGALIGSTGLAAAGVLPDAAQDAFSKVLDKVGITVPPGSDHPASSGEELSGVATTTDATGGDKGAAISSVPSGGKSQAGQHGAPVTGAGGGSHGAPAGHESHGGGKGTAGAAGHDATDATTSHDHPEGRSSAGSGNASSAPSVRVAPSKPPAHAH